MALVDTAAIIVHLVFAAVWVGSVVFMTVGLLPLARDGEIEPKPVELASGTLRSISRLSALLLLLSGAVLAESYYTADSLFGTVNGYLVLTMVVLWFVLISLLEISASRLEDGLQAKRVRAPAHETLGWFRAASVIGFLLLVVGGLLSSSWSF